MRWGQFYKFLFFSGIVLVVISLFFPVTVFFVLISVGLLFILFSLFEQHLLHSTDHPAGENSQATPPAHEKAVSHAFSPPSRHFSLFRRKPAGTLPSASSAPAQPAIDSSFLKPAEEKTPLEHASAQQKPADLDVIIKDKPNLSEREKKIELLRQYIRNALKNHYPLETIKEAGNKGNWPPTLLEKILDEETKRQKMLRLGVLGGFFLLLVLVLVVLAQSGLFILPYWVESLQSASPTVLFSVLGVVLLLILVFVVKIMKAMKTKKIEYRVQEEQHVQEIQSTVFAPGDKSYETDLDKLYRILGEKKKLTLSEVARGFNIEKAQAEEWGKILKEQNLIDINYPPVGEAELVWKPLKSTQ